jgi:hypothetical protein
MEMRVWVWHNGMDSETIDVVSSLSSHPRFHKMYHSSDNQKLRNPTNWFWENSDGAFLSKVDDDCLLPDGWGRKLREALLSNSKLGIIGCWRYYDEDFLPEAANKKIQLFSENHRVMVHGFVQGSGYVMRRDIYRQCGRIRESESFTTYCLRSALNGWVNGWYFPFIHEDHMDDPRSPNYSIKDDKDFVENLSLTQKNRKIFTLDQWLRYSRIEAIRLQEVIIDPRSYFGMRGFANKIRRRLFPRKNFWEL